MPLKAGAEVKTEALTTGTAGEGVAVCENTGQLCKSIKSLSGVFSDDTNSDMTSDDDMSRCGRETPPPRSSHSLSSEYPTPPGAPL